MVLYKYRNVTYVLLFAVSLYFAGYPLWVPNHLLKIESQPIETHRNMIGNPLATDVDFFYCLPGVVENHLY